MHSPLPVRETGGDGSGGVMAGSAEKKQYGTVQSVILSAASPGKALEKAKETAAGILCRAPGRRPCGECPSCRKIAHGTHPDVITVRRQPDSKGNLRKEITVGQIREISMDAYILPNESDRKVYIIEEADRMNENAQNAALKLLEEPPNEAVLLLCVVNPAALLPTVRSRCTEENINGERDQFGEEARTRAEDYLRAAATRKKSEMLVWCYQNENAGGEEFLEFLQCVREEIADMLCGRRPAQGLEDRKLLDLEKEIEICIRYRKANVSVKLLSGRLAVCVPSGNKNDQSRYEE